MGLMDFSIFKEAKILVTGSTGFKGSWLCAWLNTLGADVSGLALPPKPDAPLFDQLKLRERIKQYDGDIRDIEAIKKVLNEVKPEIVFHLAAQALVRYSYDEPKITFDTNVLGAVNLLEAIRAINTVKSLVFVTSDKCYWNKEWVWGYRENDELGGHDPYSASKAAAELVFSSYQDSFFQKQTKVQAASARAGNVIGGGDFSMDRIVPDCIRALASGEEIVLRNPESTRPWQHVLEPLSGYMTIARELLIRPDDIRGAWNFGPDPENVHSVKDLAKKSIEYWGSGSLKIAGNTDQPFESNLLMLNVDKSKSILGWVARWNFDQAVKYTVQWYRRVQEGKNPIEVTDEQIKEYSE